MTLKQTLTAILSLLLKRWYILLPVLSGLVFAVLASKQISTYIPTDLNATAWKAAIHSANDTLHMTSTAHQIFFLLSVHFLQVLLLFPLLHVTKMLYGFWLGPLWGWVLCCAWELTLILAYLLTVPVHPVADIHDIVLESRAQKQLWIELVILALSSTPLQVDACLLEFGGVTVMEFFTANVLVTCVMTFKNTFCGYLISTAFSVVNVAIITTVISLSTLIPTLATVYISSRTLYQCFQIYRNRQNSSDEHENKLLTASLPDARI